MRCLTQSCLVYSSPCPDVCPWDWRGFGAPTPRTPPASAKPRGGQGLPVPPLPLPRCRGPWAAVVLPGAPGATVPCGWGVGGSRGCAAHGVQAGQAVPPTEPPSAGAFPSSCPHGHGASTGNAAQPFLPPVCAERFREDRRNLTGTAGKKRLKIEGNPRCFRAVGQPRGCPWAVPPACV